MAIPPRPSRIAHDTPPPGVQLRLLSFNDKRPKIKNRLVLYHTNGASGEGSIASAIRHAEANPGTNTAPHFQVDRDGSAAMLLELDRKGIGNYKAADFSWVVETADTGYKQDPGISAFTPEQIETCAIIGAYAHMLDDVPISTPTAWDGTGVASHTDPFGYPLWTNARGKICPGLKKKAQVRELIMPLARQIVAAWTAPPAPAPNPAPPAPTLPIGALDMALLAHEAGQPTFWFSPNGGITRHPVRSLEHVRALVSAGAVDPIWGTKFNGDNWINASVLTVAQLDNYLGRRV